MAKGSSPNRKEMTKEGILDYQERSNNTEIYKCKNRLPSPLEFSKLRLMVETKIITISDVVRNVCRVKIETILL